jgi:Flp pilus assembly protein TadD
MRSRRIAAPLLALVALALLACRSAPQPLRIGHPPVILISIDTLRSDRISAYGAAAIETPHLDAFARDAVLFERAYSHYPLTLPSHVSLLTGLLPPLHGVRDNRDYRLGPEPPTLASRLAQAGYSTAGVVSSSVLRRQTGIARGFVFYDDALPGTRQESLRVFPQRPGSDSIAVAGEWLEGLKQDDRFFLFLHLFEPHTPYEAPEPYRSRHAEPYDAEVAYADALVGKFLQYLRDQGLYDPALIIVLSDHGEGLGDHGESEHGLLLNRETLQVPLLIKLPGGLRGGERVPDPVGLIDVMPTVLDLLDLAHRELDGRPLFGEEEPTSARPIYSETYFTRHQYGWSELKSAIADRLHYIHAPRPELYDLLADPGEQTNLIGQRAEPAELVAWVEEIGAGIESTAQLSPEELESLAALGYIGGAGVEGARQELPDPKDHIAEVEELWALIDRIGSAEEAGVERRVIELTRRLGIRNEALFRTIAGNLLRAGRPGAALEVLQPYAASTEASTRLTLGQALAELGRVERATGHFEAVLAVDADNAEAHLGLGLLALGGGKTDRARAALERAVALEPALPEAWNGLGVIYARAGDLVEAERMWQRAVTLDPQLSDTWYNLALIHRQQGSVDEALASLRRYAELVQGAERQRALAMARAWEASLSGN